MKRYKITKTTVYFMDAESKDEINKIIEVLEHIPRDGWEEEHFNNRDSLTKNHNIKESYFIQTEIVEIKPRPKPGDPEFHSW